MVGRLLAIIIALAPLFGAQAEESVSRQEDATAFHLVFGDCGDPCVIKPNGGGFIETFRSAAQEVRAGLKKRIVIGVPCASACAIFADLARPRVCITEGAVFLFHLARRPDLNINWLMMQLGEGPIHDGPLIVRYSDPPQSADIDTWVKSQGGYPMETLLEMPFSVAQRFWPVCPTQQTRR